MPDVQVDGFKFSQWAGGKLLLQVESDRLAQCVEYCNAKQVEWLHISPYHGYNLENVDFLQQCPRVIGIHLQRGFYDYRGLYTLPKLRSLSAIFNHNIDMVALPSLQDFSTDWNLKIDHALLAAGSLKRLWLRGYKPKSRNLEGLSELNSLEDLSIILSPIHSVQGIGMLHKLRRLCLAYCRQIEDIKPLVTLTGSLDELEISHCKKIKELDSIRDLRILQKVILFDTGELPSLSFIRQMSCLKFLSFVGVNVLDGDMTPCFQLEFAGFMKKRHYSHTPEQVQSAIQGG